MSTLTLSIINLDQILPSVTARRVFDHRGGSLGSHAADWLIDDPEHRIAPIHCEIRWVEGSFCVVDRSGHTYLNGSCRCVGAYSPRRLHEGDQLHVGAYRLLVQFASASTGPLEGLFNPAGRLFEQWLAEADANAWLAERRHTRALPEIYSALAPASGHDPLAALDAAAAATPSPHQALEQLIAGERL